MILFVGCFVGARGLRLPGPGARPFRAPARGDGPGARGRCRRWGRGPPGASRGPDLRRRAFPPRRPPEVRATLPDFIQSRPLTVPRGPLRAPGSRKRSKTSRRDFLATRRCLGLGGPWRPSTPSSISNSRPGLLFLDPGLRSGQQDPKDETSNPTKVDEKSTDPKFGSKSVPGPLTGFIRIGSLTPDRFPRGPGARGSGRTKRGIAKGGLSNQLTELVSRRRRRPCIEECAQRRSRKQAACSRFRTHPYPPVGRSRQKHEVGRRVK